MKPSRSLINIAGIVAIATLISKLFGLLRSTTMAAAFGVGPVVNAFNYSYIIPGFLLIVIGGLNGPLHTALVSVLARRDESDRAELVTTIATFLTLILIPVTLGIIIFAPLLIDLIAPGLSSGGINSQVREIAISQLQIMAPLALFAGFIGVGIASLNAGNLYWLPSVSPMLSSITVISSLGILAWYLGNEINTPQNLLLGGMVLAGGTLAGAVLQWCVQLMVQAREGLLKFSQIRPRFNFRSPEVREVMDLMFPATLSTGMSNINLYVDLRFASYIPQAAATLNYAQSLSYTPRGLLASILLVPLLQRFSRLAADREWEQLKEQVRQSIVITALIILPLSALMMVLATPIVKIVYQRSSFDNQAVQMVSSVLVVYSLGMFPDLVRQILTRVCYALNDAHIPFRISGFNILLNVALDYIFVKYLGMSGLVLASIGVNVIAGGMLLVYLNRQLDGLPWRKWGFPILGAIAGSIFAGLTAWVTSWGIETWVIKTWGL
ncbi:MAG: murein biosynthesis integral membrane protein MurJ, partial [Calothrix sp. MO_167.B42]|nr:murein biosynthesis integral membrane protein MurJ [Calothrix sp. MO_167.B42]